MVSEGNLRLVSYRNLYRYIMIYHRKNKDEHDFCIFFNGHKWIFLWMEVDVKHKCTWASFWMSCLECLESRVLGGWSFNKKCLVSKSHGCGSQGYPIFFNGWTSGDLSPSLLGERIHFCRAPIFCLMATSQFLKAEKLWRVRSLWITGFGNFGGIAPQQKPETSTVFMVFPVPSTGMLRISWTQHSNTKNRYWMTLQWS